MTNQKYILDENHNLVPVELLVWAEWFENRENRQVAIDEINGTRVSTVFMGIDHNFSDEGGPLLFETMTFGSGEEIQERYHTWDEALAGHKKILTTLEAKK